jgi:hypothetical protein
MTEIDLCPCCSTPLAYAPGIGPFCGVKTCPVTDDAAIWPRQAVLVTPATPPDAALLAENERCGVSNKPDDGYVAIQSEFWGNFIGDHLAEKWESESVVRRLYADRQTYQDWTKGEFVVWHNDGRKEAAYGVIISSADLEAGSAQCTHFSENGS